MKKKQSKKKFAPVVNRRAHYDYDLSDRLTVGLALNGQEVRAIRDHHATIRGAYVTLRSGEFWLLGLTLGSETARDIKLLATKRQIANFAAKKQAGFTIVPLELISHARHIKLLIALGQGKKRYDKRQSIKARDLDREKRRSNLS